MSGRRLAWRDFTGPTKSNPFVGPFSWAGAWGMTEYRLYSLGGNGERTNVFALGAIDDADAIDQVEVMQVSSSCELWERARLVASFQVTAPAPVDPLKSWRPFLGAP